MCRKSFHVTLKYTLKQQMSQQYANMYSYETDNGWFIVTGQFSKITLSKKIMFFSHLEICLQPGKVVYCKFYHGFGIEFHGLANWLVMICHTNNNSFLFGSPPKRAFTKQNICVTWTWQQQMFGVKCCLSILMWLTTHIHLAVNGFQNTWSILHPRHQDEHLIVSSFTSIQ